jgi:hypothetical protein
LKGRPDRSLVLVKIRLGIVHGLEHLRTVEISQHML